MGVKFKIRLQLVRIYIFFFICVLCTPTCNRYKNIFTDFKRSIWKKDDGYYYNIFYFRIFYEIIATLVKFINWK